MSIHAQTRENSGTGVARKMRAEGTLPCVIYGGEKNPQSVSIKEYDVMMALQKGGFFTTLQDISVDGKKEKVLPKAVQRHPVTERPIHVDFLRLSPKSEVTVPVDVHIIEEEESPGVKIGGLVQVVRPTIDLICRADNLPHMIEVSVAGLEIGDSVHISAVKLPDGARCAIQDRDFTVATIISTRSSNVADEEADAEIAAAAGEGGEETEGATEPEGSENAEGEKKD